MSIIGICANPAMASRQAATDASVAARVPALENPLLRPAIARLAAIRFTSPSDRADAGRKRAPWTRPKAGTARALKTWHSFSGAPELPHLAAPMAEQTSPPSHFT